MSSLDGQGWLLRASDPLPAFSANPLELLPVRQRLVFLGKAFRAPMAHVAAVLGISRETAYQDLRAATNTLTPHRRGLGPEAADAGDRSGLREAVDSGSMRGEETMPTDTLLTTAQVAKQLGVGTDAVRLMVREGRLRAAATVGNGWRLFAPADVAALAKARKAKLARTALPPDGDPD